MEASTVSSQLPAPPHFEPNTENVKRKLLRKGVYPSPKITRALVKKEIEKHNRKLKRLASRSQTQNPALTKSQKQVLAEESHFQIVKREYKDFTGAVNKITGRENGAFLVGKPWERIERMKLKELASESREFNGEKLKRENLRELREMFEKDLRWVLNDDIELQDDWLVTEKQRWDPAKRRRSEAEAIRGLVDRLSGREVTARSWKFVRMMKMSGLQFTEGQLLKIVEGLGAKGSWRSAVSVVEWVYGDKERRDFKSRFVYTKLLAVLGKARRPQEALRVFSLMRGDCYIYPDLAAYHSITVTLGQAGLLRELVKIIDCMREKPSKGIKNVRSKNWNPVLEPDLVVYNAVLNACVLSHQWKGVYWVFEQLRKNGLRPNGATYGLAMEVMLQSGKYELVHEFFQKMQRSGEAPKALTYKVLVKAFWKEGKINKAVEAVRDMERRGVVGIASVYYELACCLCNNGRWQDAITEVEKIKKLPHHKPLEVTFTGLILSSMDGGHIDDCISIFDHMKRHCKPNIGTINTMIKVYGRNDMFYKAKDLFEEINGARSSPYTSMDRDGTSVIPDVYTYSSMLEAAASALHWEYFEYVYKEMALSGYQLDQTKHASLIVEASRAGKFHLLEHAFDTILEAGEIPDSLIFTEMIIQSTAQSNCDRAVTLVNAMGHAGVKLNERQWTDLFKYNEDRTSPDSLKKLLEALFRCGLVSETIVANLSRALRCICRIDSPGEFSTLSSVNGEAAEESSFSGKIGGFDDGRRVSPPNCSATTTTGSTSDCPGLLISTIDVTCDQSLYKEEDDADEDELSGLPKFSSNKNRLSDVCSGVEGFEVDVPSSEANGCLDNKLSIFELDEHSEDVEENFEVLIDEVGDSHGTYVPSANDILERWKESRERDGIFFPFQLGQK